MHEILVISGKGGTGKTSLTAALAHLAEDPIICDLDVDAPDLHLLLGPDHRETHAFHAGNEARIQAEKCEACGTCELMCKFGAISPGDPVPAIDPLKCEGCKVCVHFCPSNAIAFDSRHCGTWYVSGTRFGPLVHAQLFPAQENSGRLVALLRQKAREMAKAQGRRLIISDGPPGIGCPVISALAGAHLAVIVTEPTPSGLHDMERITDLCGHFKVPVAVIINKCDLNAGIADRILSTCRQNGFPVAGRLPHDMNFVHAMVRGQTITEFSNGDSARQIREAWEQVAALTTGKAGSLKEICVQGGSRAG